jgi:hypothetical protein
MKSKKIYGLLSAMALTAVCASAFAQDGPPQGDQNGQPTMQRRDGGPGGQGMRRMGPGMEPLFMRPDVQKELKLTDDQIEKLKALMPRPRMGGPGGGGPGDGGPDGIGGPGGAGPGSPGGEGGDLQGGPPGGGQRRVQGGGQRGGQRGGGPGGEQGMRRMGGPDQMDSKLGEILSDGQLKRLKQLRLQREGGMSLMRKDIAEKVGLSDDERQKLRGMVDEAMQAMRPDQGQDGPPDRKTMEAMHKKLSEQILGSLSSKQHSKWNDLIGKPFKFDENWHPRRPQGGPGGPEGDSQRGGDGPPPPADDNGGNLEAALVMEALHAPDECL